jgi:UDP-N-acetylmuramyl-tripeptide synthetase
LMQLLDSPEQATQWLRERVGSHQLQTDSRLVRQGDAFIAWPGAATDGRLYVSNTLQEGASACLVEAEGVEGFAFRDERIAAVVGLKAKSGWIAAEYFGHPSRSLDILAVTGTNGKTSTAWWLSQALNTIHSQSLRKREQTLQYYCGLIGTLGMGLPGQMRHTGLTTPDPVTLQAELARLRDGGAKACAMEASSIGLVEHRMAGVQTRVALFTNFTQDHLDYHGDMETYWLAKRALFDSPGLHAVVINIDDVKGDELVSRMLERQLAVITTSQLRTDATLWAGAVEYLAQGIQFEVHEGEEKHKVTCPVVGDYNAANMLGVIGGLRALGIGLEHACEAIAHCTPVPGRMQMVSMPNAPLMVVDYAHTPDALNKALDALSHTALARGGQLWCVFGCGGNRDSSKRPLMAQAVQQGAQQAVLTSDNPRDENPETIAQAVMKGFARSYLPRVRVELARDQAIALASREAAPEDVILIAGKGHEDYQEIAGVKHPFSDIEHAQTALQPLQPGGRG